MADGPLPFKPRRPHAFPPSQRLAPGLGAVAQVEQRARVRAPTCLNAETARELGLSTLKEIAELGDSEQARVQAARALLEISERGDEVPQDANTVEALIPYLQRHGYEIVKRPGQAS
jgi:hypothetical protein